MSALPALVSPNGPGVVAQPGDTEEGLWQLWRTRRDENARGRLLELHLPYARVVAASYFTKRFNDEVPFDEYLQMARLGLIEAMDRYDPAVGVQFRSFAAPRMHGSIVDGLEVATEKQQQIAARRRLEAQRRDSIAQAGMGGLPEGTTPAARTHEQVLQFVAEAGLAFALAWLLDGTGLVRAREEEETVAFYRSVELRELRERILELVRNLPAQERQVIHGHYLQEQPFEAIALQMRLSRSRISQLHHKALARLRDLLRAPPPCDIAL